MLCMISELSVFMATNSIFFLCACFAFAAAFPTPSARAALRNTPNALCQANSIHSFKLRDGFIHFPIEKTYPGPLDFFFLNSIQYRGLDLCLIESDQVPLSLHNLIDQLGQINRQVKNTFGNDFFEYILPEGLALQFRSSDRGTAFTRTGKTLELKAFHDWNGEPIDYSAYVRQLGHFLMESPALLSWRSPIIQEGIPDLLALIITGSAGAEAGLPECFAKNIRGPFTKGGIGFQSPARFFDWTFLPHNLFNECCKESHSEEQSSLPSLQPNSHNHLKSACKALSLELIDLNLQNALSPSIPPLSGDFNPAQCFDQVTGFFQPKSCGRYSTGAVMSQFLFELSQKITSRSFSRLIVRFLVLLANQPIPREQFSCKLKKSPKQDVFHVAVNTEVPMLFHLIKMNISPSELIEFDALWDQYGMEMGMDLDSLFRQNQIAVHIASLHIFNQIKSDPYFMLSARPCTASGQFSLRKFASTPGCEVVCQRSQ